MKRWIHASINQEERTRHSQKPNSFIKEKYIEIKNYFKSLDLHIDQSPSYGPKVVRNEIVITVSFLSDEGFEQAKTLPAYIENSFNGYFRKHSKETHENFISAVNHGWTKRSDWSVANHTAGGHDIARNLTTLLTDEFPEATVETDIGVTPCTEYDISFFIAFK